jgi:hypothetical protein
MYSPLPSDWHSVWAASKGLWEGLFNKEKMAAKRVAIFIKEYVYEK